VKVRFLALAALAACTSHGASSGADAGAVTIQLVQCPWDASRIDAAIARALLTEQMGIAAQVTEVDEYSQWAPIASGQYHASLEVWPSGHAQDIANYVDTGRVEDGGPLGPIGKIGWYIPSYLLTTYPQLASWEGFKDPNMVALFQAPDTAPHGRFLAGDPTWTQYDADIIKNLGIDFQVVYAGSEQAEIAALEDAYSRRAPILMYMWTPQWALAEYSMTQVSLPPYSDACYAKAQAHGIDCDYPTDKLFKILWPGLAAASPRAYAMLKQMQLTTADQIQLLDQVNAHGASIDDAAHSWISANVATWQQWLQ
jgi:glycine betaine/proline transport system substrate-binding protein